MSQSIIDELVTLLGFKVDSSAHPTLNKFNQSIESVGKFAAVAMTFITGAATALVYFAEKSAQAGAEIERFHMLTGMSTDSIQRWTYAAGQISGNKQSILGDIQSITAGINPLMPGQFNQGLYLMFGDKLKGMKDANQVLKEMAPLFQRMTSQKAMQWGNLIGISPETVMLLHSGKLDTLFKQANGTILSPAQVEASYKFAQNWERFKLVAERAVQEFAIKLFPAIEKVFKATEKWLSDTKNWEALKQGTAKLVEYFGKAADLIVLMLDHTKTFIGLWVAGSLLPTVSTLFTLFTNIGGAIKTATVFAWGLVAANTAAAETGAAAGAATAAGAGGIGALIKKVAPWLLGPIGAGVAAFGYTMSATDAGDADEESKVKGWADRTKGARVFDPELLRQRAINQQYLNKVDPAQGAATQSAREGGTVNQTNNYNIRSTDPMGVSSEIRYLHQMGSRDPSLGGLTPGYN